MSKKKAREPVIQAPIPIREPEYWLKLTQTQCLALVDGIVPEEVKAMAGMVETSIVSGIEPYAVVDATKGDRSA